METAEKVRLIHEAREAIVALGRILDCHDSKDIDQRLQDACSDAMMGLTLTVQRLEAEVGTDNL
jgi:hypothetical protein